MSEGGRRTVLMLAYFFPPLGGGGTQRTVKNVKYLPDHGYRAIVVTVRPDPYSVRDTTLLGEIPAGTSVIRARAIPMWALKWGLHGALTRLGLSTRITAYTAWPDEMAGWIPAATWHALKVIRQHRADVLYTTSSPASAHLIGLLVSRSTGIPWIADFRDPWTLNPWAERPARPVAALSRRAERAVVRRATEVVVAAESVEVLGLPHGHPKLTVICNGVDPDDIGSHAAPDRSRFRLSYVGSLYGEYNCAPIFEALRGLIRNGSVDPARLEVRIVGPPPAREALDGLPVTMTGYVEHSEAVAEMSRAGALLFHVPASSAAPSGKIYEYLVSGRPILCVATKENLAFQLVAELGAGPCVEPHDIEGVARAILDLFARWEDGRLHLQSTVREETIRRFSRATLAGLLAGVFDRAIERAGPLLA